MSLSHAILEDTRQRASSETARISSTGGSRTLQEERTQDDDEAEWQIEHRRRPSGLWERTPGPRTTLTAEDAEATGSERRGGSERRDSSKRRGSSVQRGRRTTCPSTPPLSCRSSRRANSPSAETSTPTRKHSALLAVLRLLLRSGWLFSLPYVRPLPFNSF